jgi:hypothetical protein
MTSSASTASAISKSLVRAADQYNIIFVSSNHDFFRPQHNSKQCWRQHLQYHDSHRRKGGSDNCGRIGYHRNDSNLKPMVVGGLFPGCQFYHDGYFIFWPVDIDVSHYNLSGKSINVVVCTILEAEARTAV